MRDSIKFAALIALIILPACSSGFPDTSSAEYQEVVSSFYVGVAAMEVGEDVRANAKLTRVTELAPDEPAAWANLGLLALRRGEVDAADAYLRKARARGEGISHIQLLSAQLELYRGQPPQAHGYLRKAIAHDSTNLRAAYLLASGLVETEEGDAEAGLLLRHIATTAPDNAAVLLALLGRAADAQDTAALHTTFQALEALSSSWGPEPTAQLAALLEAIATGDTGQVARQVAFLRNVLLSEPGFRKNLAALQAPPELIGDPMTAFGRLQTPRSAPSEPDLALDFVLERLLQVEMSPKAWIGALALGNAGLPAVFIADGAELTTLREETWAFPGGEHDVAPGLHGVTGIDYDFDFRTDVLLAGAGGLRILRQDSTEAFADVTASLGLDAAITETAYTGAWVADLDLEGDVDIVLATEAGPVQVLQNNGDGTFTPVEGFEDITNLRQFVWADFDQDGDPDAVLLDTAGTMHIRENLRQGRFRPQAAPPVLRDVLDITVGDSNSDGILDLLALRLDGLVVQMSWIDQEWTLQEIANWGAHLNRDEPVRLLPADIDNNGALDLVASSPRGGQVWLQDEAYTFQMMPSLIDFHVFAVASIRQAGQLELIGLDDNRQPARLAILTTKGYHWKQIHPRAAQAMGDQRINSFGIGGEVELRSGTLYQKQPITQPFLHFGLGEQLLADVARITWPNGTVQAEFEMLSDQVVSAQQRLKGSCPWLFTHNGEEMTFVTDFIWRSPLGLRINAQETAGIMTTEDWVKIRGDQLRAVQGQYDVRITAELWETHFFDHVSLLAVDHPVGSEIYIDERFAFPPPELRVHVTGPAEPVAQVWDDYGNDVTGIVRKKDERYLDFFGRGAYQGITRDHYTEIDLGEGIPDASVLVASGWIRPTDSSINVAISQGSRNSPHPLRLEAKDATGAWRTVYENLGFPAGKAKTILIDLEGVFAPDAPRHLRLHANMEIYWDAFAWAEKRSTEQVTIRQLAPGVADLRYRGYSVVHEADKSSPELPDYNTLATRVPIWRDLVGYYTRFGDVRELLDDIDDRYVIMNAGDELALRFEAIPEPPAGWRRDFVLIGDGWVKDGDYNTTFSTTVRPLPTHAVATYDRAPGALQDDPVYEQHARDWQTYHTRYVAPDHFKSGIRLDGVR